MWLCVFWSLFFFFKPMWLRVQTLWIARTVHWPLQPLEQPTTTAFLWLWCRSPLKVCRWSSCSVSMVRASISSCTLVPLLVWGGVGCRCVLPARNGRVNVGGKPWTPVTVVMGLLVWGGVRCCCVLSARNGHVNVGGKPSTPVTVVMGLFCRLFCCCVLPVTVVTESVVCYKTGSMFLKLPPVHHWVFCLFLFLWFSLFSPLTLFIKVFYLEFNIFL